MNTVKFNPEWVTPDVVAEVRAALEGEADIGAEDFEAVYSAALVTVRDGGNLPPLYQALIATGLKKLRASEIAIAVNSLAASLIPAEPIYRPRRR